MRSRYTNYLQVTVLITGILYIVIGLAFYFAPLSVLALFTDTVLENWHDLIKRNEMVAPFYYMTRGLAALLLASGLAMILPLFDPLKYRGLVYANGVIFPFLAIMLAVTRNNFEYTESIAGTPLAAVLLLAIALSGVFVLNLSALLITGREARAGLE